MRPRLILLLASLLTVPTIASAACGSIAVCGDAVSTFGGQSVGETIVLTWGTDDEDPTILEYRIKRRACSGCAEQSVATVDAVGSCGTLEPYDYTDTDPGSAVIWTLEVWRTLGGQPVRACAIDTIPQ